MNLRFSATCTWQARLSICDRKRMIRFSLKRLLNSMKVHSQYSWDRSGASATIQLIAISYFSFLILYSKHEILAKRKQALFLDVCTNMQVLKMWILIIKLIAFNYL